MKMPKPATIAQKLTNTITPTVAVNNARRQLAPSVGYSAVRLLGSTSSSGRSNIICGSKPVVGERRYSVRSCYYDPSNSGGTYHNEHSSLLLRSATTITVNHPVNTPRLSSYFSTATTQQQDEDDDDDTTPQQRQRRNTKPERKLPERKDAITVTPRAAQRLAQILSTTSTSPPPVGIRLGVKRRGCNGLSYTLNYATERKPNEEAVVTGGEDGVTVFIEPMALFSIVGTVMDWEESELSSEFTFRNPNSKGECGCGESFNV